MIRERARQAIIDLLKNDLIIWSSEDDYHFSLVFVDPRKSGSLRLTEFGYLLLKDKFPHWSENIPHVLTMSQHTYIISVSKFPYFFEDDKLVTFDADLGVLIKMVAGDFEKLEKLNPRN